VICLARKLRLLREPFSCQLHYGSQLRWAAIEIGGGSGDISVPGQRLKQVNCGAFVGQVCEERSAAMTLIQVVDLLEDHAQVEIEVTAVVSD
jgi:hypothetical protein